ncbi:hypothetical protein FQR65_LT20865 [Abscondita terminalis]|nr:hypothetical protein FQR65_LT20865 [Abscondita terminalis]
MHCRHCRWPTRRARDAVARSRPLIGPELGIGSHRRHDKAPMMAKRQTPARRGGFGIGVGTRAHVIHAALAPGPGPRALSRWRRSVGIDTQTDHTPASDQNDPRHDRTGRTQRRMNSIPENRATRTFLTAQDPVAERACRADMFARASRMAPKQSSSRSSAAPAPGPRVKEPSPAAAPAGRLRSMSTRPAAAPQPPQRRSSMLLRTPLRRGRTPVSALYSEARSSEAESPRTPRQARQSAPAISASAEAKPPPPVSAGGKRRRQKTTEAPGSKRRAASATTACASGFAAPQARSRPPRLDSRRPRSACDAPPAIDHATAPASARSPAGGQALRPHHATIARDDVDVTASVSAVRLSAARDAARSGACPQPRTPKTPTHKPRAA